ncbi:MAG: heavy metal translocating P-type ATPase [Dehalococcoidia bacterium]
MDVDERSEKFSKLQVKIGGMQCSFCLESIRKAFLRMDGVSDVSVSLAHEEALISYDPRLVSPQKLKDTLLSLGYSIRDPDKLRSFEEEEAELRQEKNRLLVAAGTALLSLGFMAAMWLGFRQPWFRWVMLALALGTMFGPGWYIKKMAWASLRRGILNQHVLLEAAAFGGLSGGLLGLFYSAFPMPDFLAVAVFVTGYHILSGYVSLLVRTRSSQAIKKLMALQPPVARVWRSGREEEVPIEQVQPGDLVRIRPGENVSVDGVVVEGTSAVNQSLVTGEPMPVEKGPGDEVIGGSVNQTGFLLVRVTRVGAESFLQRVAQHIQEARALKPGIVQLVDRVLKYFVPGVLTAAGLAFVIWSLGAWLVRGEPDFTRAVFAALAVLVMGYPCALGMATPLAMIQGGGAAARRGILMRSGEAFQVFKDVRKVVLDKTGTITRGKPEVIRVVALDVGNESEILRLSAAVEAASEHPLGRAIVERAHREGVQLPQVTDFRAHPGKGVQAVVKGELTSVGTSRFLLEQGMDISSAQGQQREFEGQGLTVVLVSSKHKAIGLIAIGDAIKEEAPQAIAEMRAEGLEPVMVTGDNWRTARAVAAQVGIAEVLAEVLPGEKAEAVRRLQGEGHRVAMVGDGINDAPALMQADVGIAIGAGTDIAVESADIVLVGSGLDGVLEAYHIGRSSFAKTVQNVALAFTFNGLGISAAMTGLLHPVWAMVAMAASITTVLLNSFGGRPGTSARFRQGKEPQSISLYVPSIHCEGCAATIEAALKRLRSVKTVEVDVAEKMVTVGYRDGKRAEKDIREGIARAGHTVAGSVHKGNVPDPQM